MTENSFERFWGLGYRLLLPIVPPGAAVSESSTLFKRIGTSQDSRGKVPGESKAGKWFGIDLTTTVSTEHDLPKWQTMGASTGIRTGRQPDGTWLLGLDADTLNRDRAKIISDKVTERLGRLPVRVGQYPKALYLCRVDGLFQYQRIEFGERDANDKLSDRLEVLSDGRQFVAAGQHPKTGKPYNWPREPVPYKDLPVFKPEQITALLEELRGLLPAASKVIVEGGGADVNQGSLRAPLDVVRKAVAAIPNTSNHFPSRESYVQIGYAIKAALPDNEAEAFELFSEWCSRWTDGTNDPDVVEADWRRMKGPYKRGAGWLIELAQEHGGELVWFEPVPDEAPLFPIGEPVAPAATEGIKWVRPAEWTGRTPPAREWEVEGWIPRGEVSLLYGDGGIGKTLLIHMYATAAAAGVQWLGQKTRKAKVMCFFCEDSEDELLRRQIDINHSLGVTFEDTDENLRIASRKYMDNLLILWDRNTGAMKRQAIWDQLRSDALTFGADVIVVDTIADTFGGSEIDRAQVNAFVKSCLGRLAQEIGGSVIALGHPSLSGKASGSGTSGSTAWSNAVRSRLYLRYPKGVEKGNIRELEGMKLNYGPKGNVIKLRWNRGAFDVVAASMAPVGDGVGNADGILPTIEQAGDAMVLDAIVASPGVAMNLKVNSPHYAPRVLKRREPDLLGEMGNEEVEAAVLRLEARGAIKAGEVGRDAYRRPIQGFSVVRMDALEADSLSENVFD